MAPVKPPRHRPAEPLARLRPRLVLARGVLAWEALWRAVWPAATALALFLALALMDVPSRLGGWAHAGLLVVALAAVAGLGWWGLRRVDWPDLRAGLRRLETDSHLDHRPLATLGDTLATGTLDTESEALWRLHLERQAERARRLRLDPPRPGVAARDPWALRAAALLLLVVGLVVAGRDAPYRLGAAFVPDLSGREAEAATVALDVWITPPEYTARPPVFLRPTAPDGGMETIQVPAGSEITGRVAGGGQTPEFAMQETGAAEAAREPFAPEGAGFVLQRTVDASGRIEVTQGRRVLGSWQIDVIPDEPPTVGLAGPPTTNRRGALQFGYEAKDDYGVVSLRAMIRLAEEEGYYPEDAIDLDLPVVGRSSKRVKGQSRQDLIEHPWAGREVLIQLVATDELGQVGLSEPFYAFLPERSFSHPVAQVLIDLRARLMRNYARMREHAAAGLAWIAVRPALYDDDTTVFLGLSTLARQLAADADGRMRVPSRELLWDLAVHLDGDALSPLEQEISRLQDELREALERGAPDEEIEALMQQLREAMEQLFAELRQQNPRPAPGDTQGRLMTEQDLREMMDRARELMRSGDRESAQRMLDELRSMMENLQAARPSPQQQQADELARQLQDLARRQQELMDRTWRRSQGLEDPGRQRSEGDPSQQGSPQPGEGQEGEGELAAEQEMLRQMLEDARRRLEELMQGQSPESLGDAQQSMGEAGQALGDGRTGDAVQNQADALNALRQGMQDFSSQRREGSGQMADMPGAVFQQNSRGSQGRDPLGRPMPGRGMQSDTDVELPSAPDAQRSREILEELRRRLGDPDRPAEERDYIDRLLRRF